MREIETTEREREREREREAEGAKRDRGGLVWLLVMVHQRYYDTTE